MDKRLFARALVMAPLFVGGVVGTGLVGPLRTSIEAEFALSRTAFGAGLAVLQVLTSLALVLGTDRLHKHGDLRILRAAFALQIAGFVTVFVSSNLAWLVVGWGCILLGNAATPICNNISMSLWPENPRRGVTLLHAYNALGKVAGPMIAAGCLAIGWRYSFLSVAGITAVILVMFSLAGRNIFAEPEHAAPEKRAVPAGRARAAHWHALSMFGLIAGGEAAFATLAPAFYEKVQGLTPQQAGLLFTVHLLGLAAGRFFFGFFGGRFSHKAIIGICLSATLFVVPAILIPSWAWRIAGLFIFGVAFSSTWPTYYAQIAGLFRRRARLLAYGAALMSHVGMSAFIFISSAIADRSLKAAMFFGPAIMALFGVFYFATWLARPEAVIAAEESSV